MKQTPRRVVETVSGLTILLEFTCPQCSGKGWFRNALKGCLTCRGKGVVDGVALQLWEASNQPELGSKHCGICREKGHYAPKCPLK